jgi:hypothetical protein
MNPIWSTASNLIALRYLLTLSSHRLRMFENSELRKILGPKRDEVTGVWRKVHRYSGA